jgi:hypothetical protein
MACECTIAAHDNPFNKAILGEDAEFFSSAGQVTAILNAPPGGPLRAQRSKSNGEKIKTVYNWDRIVSEYEKVLLQAHTGQ